MPKLKKNNSQSPTLDFKSLLGPKRVLFQWICTALILIIPFIHLDKKSLFRIDIDSLSLLAFGHTFPITDMPFFLLLCLLLTLLFLWTTLAFGRAWCGWACPQTTLVDLVEWFARRIGSKVSAGFIEANNGQKILLQCLYFFLSLLVGANLIWYFISPYDFFPLLLRGQLHWFALGSWLIIAATLYIDLAFLRRLFCKEFCPYGRFQTVLIDRGTLTLQYHPDEAHRCIQCGACVRSCPTGVDIRRGYQIECINCGRCLDACRRVMTKRGENGIIRYTFGLEGQGIKALFNVRMALVGTAFCLISGLLIFMLLHRNEVTISAERNQEIWSKYIKQNQIVNFFTIHITNKVMESKKIRLSLEKGQGDIILNGATTLQGLQAGEKKRYDISLETTVDFLREPRPVTLVVIDQNDNILDQVTIYLTTPQR